MRTKRTDEFRSTAVRIALTSGLTNKQIASESGIGILTLNKWITTYRDLEVMSDKDLGFSRVIERLRRENRGLGEEIRSLEKQNGSLRAKCHEVPIH